MLTPRRLPTLVVALGLAACSERPTTPTAQAPYVLASFYPLTYFAKRIAQDTVDIGCPLPEGADPVFWQPDRQEITSLQGAALILVNGASFEHWVDKVSLPESRLVDTSRGFDARFLKFETVTHSHGAGGAHTHEGTDGHTWLDPHNAKLQSQAIHDAFVKVWPQHATRFAAGLSALHQDLDALDQELQALTGKLGDAGLLASHPAYNYLAARYGWKLTNLTLDPEGEPSDADREAIAKALAPRKTVLLWEVEPKAAMLAEVEALGLRSVVFSPCESLPKARAEAGEDYLSVMRGNLARLQAALMQ